MKKIFLFSAIALILATIAISGCTTGKAITVNGQAVYTKAEVDSLLKNSCNILLYTMKGAWQSTCFSNEYNKAADVDNDGKIGTSDYSLLSTNFNNAAWCEQQFTKIANPCSTASCSRLLTIMKGSWQATCFNKEYTKAADIDNDGKVGTADYSLFSTNSNNETWCESQFTKTTDTCKTDSCLQLFATIRSAWGTTCTSIEYNRFADIDNDGTVGNGDYALLSSNIQNAAWCESQFTKITPACK